MANRYKYLMTYNHLTQGEIKIIEDRETEKPFSGEYDNFFKDGIYICRRCNNPLFSSKDKFDAQCGWPSFDDNISNAVVGVPDADGVRIAIECANCHGHLGHVFDGEGYTPQNTRHCVNSLSIRFVGKEEDLPVVLSV